MSNRRFSSLVQRLRPHVAVDIGTAWARLMRADGELLVEPTLQAVDRSTGHVLSWGRTALAHLARQGCAVELQRPIVAGTVGNFAGFRSILANLMAAGRSHSHAGRWLRPKLFVAAAAGISRVEQMALRDGCRQVGAFDLHLIDSVSAAAIGAGVPIEQTSGHLVMEMGAGRCTAALFSRYAPAARRSVPCGSELIDRLLADRVRRQYQVWVGAESIRAAKEREDGVGEAGRLIALRGMDLVTNLPRTVHINDSFFWEAARPIVQQARELLSQVVAESPPELAGDLILNGIHLTGGLAQLRGLKDALSQFTGCPVHVTAKPHLATVRGLLRIAGSPDLLGAIAEHEGRAI